MIFNDHLITDLTEIAKMRGNVIFAGLPVDDRGDIVTKNLKILALACMLSSTLILRKCYL